MDRSIKVVIDTNILVASLSSRSAYHWLIEALMEEKFELFVSTEVMLEYEEILKLRYPLAVATNFIRALNELPNVFKSEIYYQWQIIQADADDNKFVDLAISAGANYIVSNDKHFNVLKDLPFPRLNLLKLEEFGTFLKTSHSNSKGTP